MHAFLSMFRLPLNTLLLCLSFALSSNLTAEPAHQYKMFSSFESFSVGPKFKIRKNHRIFLDHKHQRINRMKKMVRKKRRRALLKKGSTQCPAQMALVYSRKKGVKVCVDKYETTLASKTSKAKPAGNFDFYSCKNLCVSKGKRLLTHLEWSTACEGTRPSSCNIFKPHPVLRKKYKRTPWTFKNINCKKGNNAWKECLRDPEINKLSDTVVANDSKNGCRSKYGIYHMVGNLGEWVDDNHYRQGTMRGRFNGGLYPQAKSSCSYTTTAHSPNYRDYSIGCRCGKNA